MNQNSPLGWGQPISERGPRPLPPAPPGQYDPHAQEIREIVKETEIMRDPAGDRPFVFLITFGTFAQVFGAALATFGFFIGFVPVAIAGAVFALWGLIALLVGIYRALSALQLIYRLVKRL